ncbi:MAG: hypothetical protein ACOH1T_02995 [Microbacteriaceae bacterium]
MANTRLEQSGYRRLSPRRGLYRQALVATMAFLGPVLIVLYALTIPDGPWGVVLATHIIASVIFTIASWSFFAAGVWVHPTGIAERGFFGRRSHYPIDQVDSIILARTLTGDDGSETMAQLFVCDENGKQLVRMRGAFWTAEAMQAVPETLDIPVTEVGESVTSAELLEDFPGLLYWFERRPVLAAFTFSAAVVAGGLIIYAVVATLGLPATG